MQRIRPGQAFSHTTALALVSAPLPYGATDLLHLSVAAPKQPPRTRGVRGHALRELETFVVDGMPVVVPAAAWAQSATVLTLRDLVAAGDFLVCDPRGPAPPLATREQLASALAILHGTDGIRRASAALARVRERVDSPAETRLRLAIVDAGLPEPETGHEIVVAGGIRLHADLAYPGARIVIEYEGDVHRTDARLWQLDIGRRELLEDAGWRVIRVTAADALGDYRVLISRLSRLLADRRQRTSL